MYHVGDIVKINDGVFTDLFGTVVDVEGMKDGCYVRIIGEEDAMYFEFSELEAAKPRDYFQAVVENAIELEVPFMYVLVNMPNCADSELIINPLVNFESKLEYYLKTYDEELNHKYSTGIKIVGFGTSESLDLIEENVYDYDLDIVDSDEVDNIEEEAEEIKCDFKVGDSVKVVQTTSSEIKQPFAIMERVGKIGVIKRISKEKRYPITVEFSDGVFYPLRVEEVELAEKTPKVGDLVLVTKGKDGYHKYNGQVGVVKETNRKEKDCLYDNLVCINNESLSFDNDEIKVLTLIDFDEFNNLEVGTKVYVKYTPNKFGSSKDGIETVTLWGWLKDGDGKYCTFVSDAIKEEKIKVYKF